MRLEGIQTGDIVEVDHKGRRFHAVAGLDALEPHEPSTPARAAARALAAGLHAGPGPRERPRAALPSEPCAGSSTA